jgi:hypothetical protein
MLGERGTVFWGAADLATVNDTVKLLVLVTLQGQFPMAESFEWLS